LLSSNRREIPTPIARYIVWVGTSLLALLFVANWFLPESLPEPAHEAIDKPVIRIASIQPPERVVIDTNQPTIVPPPALFESASSGNPLPLQSYASADPPAQMVVDSAKKLPKAIKRREARAATYQPALSNTPAVARGGSATAVPSTRLSFAEIISGQVLRNLFNLH
jgi:hypothetical protein